MTVIGDELRGERTVLFMNLLFKIELAHTCGSKYLKRKIKLLSLDFPATLNNNNNNNNFYLYSTFK